jgi:hypothetical protein
VLTRRLMRNRDSALDTLAREELGIDPEIARLAHKDSAGHAEQTPLFEGSG